MFFRIAPVFFLLLLFSGCAFFKPAVDDKKPAYHYYPAADSLMADMLNQYRPQLERRMNRKIATVNDTLRFEKPEGALGNLVADAIRYRAAEETQSYIHVGVIGEQSFNLYFEPGDLTVGDMYEFMPYENSLVILTLEGKILSELLDQIAEQGGAPVSGVRFRIDENKKARGVLVNSEVIHPEKEYFVATSSWAADGNDVFPALAQAAGRKDLQTSMRSVFADYFRSRAELSGFTDGRIRR